MPSESYKKTHERINTRATWHDYNGGIYFITICTKNREHFFGEIIDNKMQLSKIGEYTERCIKNTSIHNPYAEIPLWVVMRNHIHAIVIIKNDNNNVSNTEWRNLNEEKNNVMQAIANKQGKLSTTIGGLKQAITRFANENKIQFAWQTRFHDHIIRTTEEKNMIANYIENNVARWEYDKFYNTPN